MKKQSLLEKIVYLVVGTVFFGGYTLLMTEVFKISPFRGFALVPTAYCFVAIFTFSRAGEWISERVKDAVLPSQVVMPFVNLSGPILLVYKKKTRQHAESKQDKRR